YNENILKIKSVVSDKTKKDCFASLAMTLFIMFYAGWRELIFGFAENQLPPPLKILQNPVIASEAIFFQEINSSGQ
ncbi:MAG: hypothetical protein ACOCZI_00605, partial [Marinilabiliaceae bacterium]